MQFQKQNKKSFSKKSSENWADVFVSKMLTFSIIGPFATHIPPLSSDHQPVTNDQGVVIKQANLSPTARGPGR
jgi:hypothetical protein